MCLPNPVLSNNIDSPTLHVELRIWIAVECSALVCPDAEKHDSIIFSIFDDFYRCRRLRSHAESNSEQVLLVTTDNYQVFRRVNTSSVHANRIVP